MFTREEQQYNEDHDKYYEHLSKLELQVRLKKLYDLLQDEKYQVKKIKLFTAYNEELKHLYFRKKESIIELEKDIDPYFETLFVDDFFDITNIQDFSDAIRKCMNSSLELKKENFSKFLTNLQDSLEIPVLFNMDFNTIKKPLITKISFGDIKDVPYVIYDQKSFEEIESLSNKKQHILYEYLSESFLNFFKHINEIISQKDNNLHFIFSEDSNQYRRLNNIVLENKEGSQFIFQDLNKYQLVFLSIMMNKAPGVINRTNCESFIQNIEEGINRINPLSERFSEKSYWDFIKTDLQKKLILNNLETNPENQKENKRRL